MNSGLGSLTNQASYPASTTSVGEKAAKRSFFKGMLKGKDKKPKDEESDPNNLSPRMPRSKDRNPSIKPAELVPPGSAGRMRAELGPKRGSNAQHTSEFHINPAVFALPDYYHGGGNMKKVPGGMITPSSTHKASKKRGESFEKPMMGSGSKDSGGGKYSNVLPSEATGMSLDIFDLTNMEGIVQPLPAQQVDPAEAQVSSSKRPEPHSKSSTDILAALGSWNAPDSWAVKKEQEQKPPETQQQDEMDDIPEEILRKQSISQVSFRFLRVMLCGSC